MRAFRMVAAAVGLAIAGLLPAAPEAPEDEEAYLRRQLALFRSFSPERQEQIRHFDAELHALPAAEQERLRRAMEAYAAWLEGLPERSRNQIFALRDADGRLSAIRAQKTQDWIETLPKVRRDQYAQAKMGDRPKLIEQWRAEEEQRRDQWKYAQLHLNDPTPPNPRDYLPFNDPMFVRYLKNLGSQIPVDRRIKLEELVEAARRNEYGKPEELFIVLFGNAEHRELLPGPPNGPREFSELPPKVRAAFPNAGKKGPVKKAADREYVGKWPDYALAITKYAANNNIVLPEPVVKATRKQEMPPEVQKFIEEEIEGKLKNQKGIQDYLKAAEGKWPDYPRAIMKIAHDNKLVVPGWMPPLMPNWKKKA